MQSKRMFFTPARIKQFLLKILYQDFLSEQKLKRIAFAILFLFKIH
jgi:hypothetical protein